MAKRIQNRRFLFEQQLKPDYWDWTVSDKKLLENWEENKRKSSQADVVVLANICYGMQNIKNLEVALHAQKLIIIEDTSFFERDFTEGEAWQLYQKVLQHPCSLVVTTEEFLKMLAAGELLSFSINIAGAGA